MWLPAVGAVLFLVVGLLWALSSPSKDAKEEVPAPGASAARTPGAPQPRLP